MICGDPRRDRRGDPARGRREGGTARGSGLARTGGRRSRRSGTTCRPSAARPCACSPARPNAGRMRPTRSPRTAFCPAWSCSRPTAPRSPRSCAPACGTASRTSRAAPGPACPAALCRLNQGSSSPWRSSTGYLMWIPTGGWRRRARGDQSVHQRGRRCTRALLRPGPLLPSGLHDRRQRRGELRRRALPEVRLHLAPRAGRGDGAAGRHGRRPRLRRHRSTLLRRPRLRPARACSSAPRGRAASPPG